MTEKGSSISESREDIVSIWQRIKEKYGDVLGGKLRYECFKPVGVDDKDWLGLLGVDIDTLSHLKWTRELMKWSLSIREKKGRRPFEERDGFVLFLSSIVHDLPEADPEIGDKPSPEKTKKDRETEAQVAGKILKDVGLEKYSPAVIAVLENQEKGLGRIFRAVEMIGFLRTALRAYRVSLRFEKDDRQGLNNALQWLSGESLTNISLGFQQTAGIFQYAKDFLPVKEYIMRHKEKILAALTGISEDFCRNYGKERGEKMRREFSQTKLLWQKFFEDAPP